MICLALLVVAFAAADAATTVTMPPMTTDAPMMATTQMAATIYYDMKHHKAMVVRADGCYEYHMNHQDVLDHGSNLSALETRILDALAAAVNIQETGHNHINHMTNEITSACASVPVYSFD